MQTLRQKQRMAFWIAGVATLLALFAGAGISPLAGSGGPWVWALHPLVVALGAWAGVLTSERNREIDRTRWGLVQDPALTKGEREWAHKEAEADRKRAAASFLAAPLLISGWLAYSVREEAPPLASDLMPTAALVGFGLGLGWAYWKHRGDPPEPQQLRDS